MENVIYPTNWKLGKPRGSIKDNPNTYLLVISLPEGKQQTHFFAHSKYKNKAEALQATEKARQEISDKLGLTRNRIRYTNANTIEVELTHDKTMITDAEFLDKVQMYPLQAKNKKDKKDKSSDRYYAYYQDKKKAGKFSDLICDLKIVKFKNGNTLDLRKSNIYEFGAVENKTNVEDDLVTKQAEYFLTPRSKLPKNVWLLGKPTGTVFKRKGDEKEIITVRVNDKQDKQHTTTFKIKNYGSEKEAFIEARKWQIITSFKLGMTKNMIRILNDDSIEVKISKDNIMRTDKFLIPVVQKIPIFTSTSGNKMVYAATVIKEKNVQFHSFITCFNLTDHISGDTLDNRLCNLRPATYSMNNLNRHDPDEKMGIKKSVGLFGGDVYVASIVVNGNSYSKSFSIKLLTEEGAKQRAIDFRKKAVSSVNVSSLVSVADDHKLVEVLVNQLDSAIDHTYESIVYDEKQYIPTLKMSDDLRKRLHWTYMIHYLNYVKSVRDDQEKLKDIYAQQIIRKNKSKSPNDVKKERELKKQNALENKPAGEEM